MRDESYVEREEARLFGPSVIAQVKTGAAAAAALAVLAGLVVWGYRLSARDPSEVPVIRALEGPARTAPDEAEGAQFAHQERDVYDAVTDQQSAPEAGLAPPPRDLAAEDVSGQSLNAAREAEAAQARAESDAERRAAEAALRPAPIAPPAPEIAAAQDGAEVDRLVEAALLDQPAARPPVPVEERAPDAPLPDAAPTGASSSQLQLGAYLSRADAEANWAQLRRKFPELRPHGMTIIPITSQGRDLQALRINTLADAAAGRALCAALKTKGGDCFLVGG